MGVLQSTADWTIFHHSAHLCNLYLDSDFVMHKMYNFFIPSSHLKKADLKPLLVAQVKNSNAKCILYTFSPMPRHAIKI